MVATYAEGHSGLVHIVCILPFNVISLFHSLELLKPSLENFRSSCIDALCMDLFAHLRMNLRVTLDKSRYPVMPHSFRPARCLADNGSEFSNSLKGRCMSLCLEADYPLY